MWSIPMPNDACVTHAPLYSGARTSAPGQTVASEAGWNNWWHGNFDGVMEHRINSGAWRSKGHDLEGTVRRDQKIADRVRKLALAGQRAPGSPTRRDGGKDVNDPNLRKHSRD